MSPRPPAASSAEMRLAAPGPKRLLSIDGAGARSAVTLPILEAIESTLQRNAGDSSLRLSDYFDLIGGTGTGAVLAAALARGMSVSETRALFERSLRELFRTQGILQSFTSRYRSEGVEEALANAFGDEPLQSLFLQSGLCIFTYRVDAASPFVFHNLLPLDPSSPPLRLNQCLHASIAAPSYFEPVTISVSHNDTGVFVDADVGMTGGAATPLFLASTDEPFRFETGPEELLLVAVGSGRVPFQETSEQAQNRSVLGWAASLPSMLFFDAVRQNELFLRGIARCPLPMLVDDEMENAEGVLRPTDPALTYVRYDVDLRALASLGLADLADETERLSAHDDNDLWPDWLRIGEAVAAQQVQASHFPAANVRQSAA